MPATARDPVRGGDRAAPDSRYRAELNGPLPLVACLNLSSGQKNAAPRARYSAPSPARNRLGLPA